MQISKTIAEWYVGSPLNTLLFQITFVYLFICMSKPKNNLPELVLFHQVHHSGQTGHQACPQGPLPTEPSYRPLKQMSFKSY